MQPENKFITVPVQIERVNENIIYKQRLESGLGKND